jgi:hypothetical protein
MSSPQLIPVKSRMKVEKGCITCQVVKPRAEFHLYRYTTNQGKPSLRMDSRCKACNSVRRKLRKSEREREVVRKYRSLHREQINNQIKRHRQEFRAETLAGRIASEAKRRAKGYDRNLSATRESILQVLELYRIGNRYVDVYDGVLIDAPTIDHIEPLSGNGHHESGNLCVTSRQNNTSKHKTPLIVWMTRRMAASV